MKKSEKIENIGRTARSFKFGEKREIDHKDHWTYTKQTHPSILYLITSLCEKRRKMEWCDLVSESELLHSSDLPSPINSSLCVLKHGMQISHQ